MRILLYNLPSVGGMLIDETIPQGSSTSSLRRLFSLRAVQRKVAGQAVRNVGGEGRSRHVAVRHVVEHHAQVRRVLDMHVRFPSFGSLVSLVRWFVGSVNRAIVRIEGGLLKLGRQKQAQPVALASSTS